MKRRLLNLLTAVSLLLCVAACVLWARSYFVADLFEWGWQGEETDASVASTTQLTSSYGGVAIVRERRVRSGDPGAVAALVAAVERRQPSGLNNGWSRTEPFGYPSPSGRHTLGFALVHSRHDESFATAGGKSIRLVGRNSVLLVPYWFLAALTGWSLVPVSLSLRRRLRKRAGCCPGCGYDLRATPDRCPECGHTPAGATT
jgi:hypothetical protein